MSRLGPDRECWAVWEPHPLLAHDATITTLLRDHPDLQAAAAKIDVTI